MPWLAHCSWLDVLLAFILILILILILNLLLPLLCPPLLFLLAGPNYKPCEAECRRLIRDISGKAHSRIPEALGGYALLANGPSRHGKGASPSSR